MRENKNLSNIIKWMQRSSYFHRILNSYIIFFCLQNSNKRNWIVKLLLVWLNQLTSLHPPLGINDYKLLGADNASDTKRGRVCIYHKESISVKVYLLNLSQLPECLVCEVSIQNIREFLVALYCSPSQSQHYLQVSLKKDLILL